MVSHPGANPCKTCSWKNSSAGFGLVFRACLLKHVLLTSQRQAVPAGGGCVSVCPQGASNPTHAVPCAGVAGRAPLGALEGTTQGTRSP